MSPDIHVLVVEDSPSDALLMEEALDGSQFHMQKSTRLADAVMRLSAAHFDVVLLDLGLPDSQGMDTLRALRRAAPHVSVVVLTRNDDDELAIAALKAGAQDYLVKSQLGTGSLKRVIRYALERTGAKKLLRQSEDRFLELTAHIDQVLWIMDVKQQALLYASIAYEKMWGRSHQFLLENPRSFMDGIHPQDLEMMHREVAGMFATGHIDAECRLLRPDGSIRWIWIRGYPVSENEQLARVAGVIEDVTEKRRLEAEREALLARLQLHIERMPLAYVLFDAKGLVTDWNPAAERIFGWSREEMLGAGPPYPQFVLPSFYEAAAATRARIWAGEMDAHSRNENVTKSGRTITCQWFNTPLEDAGRVVGFLSLARDVTAEEAMQAQFQQAQKMEAFGQLAGGVAHDFNNLLTVISGYSEILLSKMAWNDSERDSVRAISEAGTRAASLTRQLLAFSRKTVLEPKVLDLNAVVRETERLLRRLIGEDVELTSVLAPRISRVRVDPGLIGQVLMNLAVNARDAMPQGGKLTIETSDAELDENYARSNAGCKAGRYVRIAVSDNGCGMTPAVRARIFEPFFTTKGPGRGTGLGLATVFGIVKQSGGHISLYTEPGRGTTFKIYFPAVDAELDPLPGDPRAAKVRGGTETILVVEDEEAVRAIAVFSLRAHGYTVLDARSGEEAMRKIEVRPGRVDLLVTDVVMPGMSGRELAEVIGAKHPGIKVLFQSGYTDDSVIRHGILEAEVAFLQKPYTPMMLAKKVRALLDDPRGRDRAPPT